MSSSGTYHVNLPYLRSSSVPPTRPSSAHPTLLAERRRSQNVGDHRPDSRTFSSEQPFAPRRDSYQDRPNRRSILPYRRVLSWQAMLSQSSHAAMAPSEPSSEPSSSAPSSSGLPGEPSSSTTPTTTHDAFSSTESEQTPRPNSAARFGLTVPKADQGGDASSDGGYSTATTVASTLTAAAAAAARRNGLRNDLRSGATVRIKVSTPKHRRARSDFSLRDLSADSDVTYDSSSSIASLASELEELCAHLPARQAPSGKKDSQSPTAVAFDVPVRRSRPRSSTTASASTLATVPRPRSMIHPGREASSRLADPASSPSSAPATSATASFASSMRTTMSATTPAAPSPLSGTKPTAVAGRRRSSTLATDESKPTRRFRASTLMQSITEEDGTRSPSRRRYSPATGRQARFFSPGNPSHEQWSRASPMAPSNTSPTTSTHPSPGSPDYDYIRFIDSDYGSSPTWGSESLQDTPPSASSHKSPSPVALKQQAALPALPTLHVSKRTRTGTMSSVVSSQLLAEQAAWLQEELARCSSDEEGMESPDPYLLPPGSGLGVPECFSTPSTSPMIAGRDTFMRLPGSESADLLGLGLNPKPLALVGPVPGRTSTGSSRDAAGKKDASKRRSHPAKAAGQDGDPASPTSPGSKPSSRRASMRRGAAPSKRDSLQPPEMPWRYSSLGTNAAMRRRSSSDSFASTQPESSSLFHEGGYSPSSSPMADNGHDAEPAGRRAASPSPKPQGRRPGSSESTDSIQSTSTHGSSLLGGGNASQAAGGASMERNASVDTRASSRPSSIGSVLAEADKLVPGRPIRSPRRADLALAPLSSSPTDAEFGGVTRATAGSPGESPRSESHPRRRSSPRTANPSNRRKTPQRPQLPARMASLDETVAAAPGQTQLREEFPEKLLGDFLADDASDDDRNGGRARVGGGGSSGGGIEGEGRITVMPLPFNMMVRSGSQTVSLPGIGEIIPPSPDVSYDTLGLDRLSPALKRLGSDAAGSIEQLPLPFRSSANASNASLASHAHEQRLDGAVVGLERSPSRIGTLKARITGRLGSSIDLIRATTASAAAPPAASVDVAEERVSLTLTPAPSTAVGPAAASVPTSAPSSAPAPVQAPAASSSSKSTSAINRFILKGGKKLSKRSKDAVAGGDLESPRLPAAWEERLASRGGERRPSSRMSISTESPSGRAEMFLDLSSPRRKAAMDLAGREAPRSATPSFASEESKGRTSSSFWRILSPSANASAASLLAKGGQSPEPHAGGVGMLRQPSGGGGEPHATLQQQPQQQPQGTSARSGSQLGFSRPSQAAEHHHSFFDLSEEEEDDDGEDRNGLDSEGEGTKVRGTIRTNGRKDLSKLFGASESDLLHRDVVSPITIPAGPAGGGGGRGEAKLAPAPSRWTASLGRSSKRSQQQQQPRGSRIAAV
ncbi:uncharacterized protein PSFLO_03519 [Pseudozyma flocculosa]|uniref:Uncharacterized protein n=1 Tax=Pseudozyma flocculosa TaxID=84751 RepID=A0A5C3F169_9BASI|nr:uncharacterized protein PSFLO_03519 [Pseudozyma flocculosa]